MVAEVRESRSGAQSALEDGLGGTARGDRRARFGSGGQEPREARVRGWVAEQVADDSIRDPKRPSQEGSLSVFHFEQAARHQGPGRREPASPGSRRGRHTTQLQRQTGGCAAPGDVVVQVSIQPLESGIQIWSQRDQKKLLVERPQTEGPGHGPEAYLETLRLG